MIKKPEDQKTRNPRQLYFGRLEDQIGAVFKAKKQEGKKTGDQKLYEKIRR